MCEELGDVLFQIIFHSDIKSDDKAFDVNDVIDGICKKMILRHPHVFGNVSVKNSDEVLSNWEVIKNTEKSRQTPYEKLDSISKSLPSLMRSQKIISKAQKYSLIENRSFDEIVFSIEHSLKEIKNSQNIDEIGHLLVEITALCSLFGVEAEEILYVENNKLIENIIKKETV